MASRRPLTRSKSKKLKAYDQSLDAWDPQFVPQPLKIQKTPFRDVLPPQAQRVTPAGIGLAFGGPQGNTQAAAPANDFSDFNFASDSSSYVPRPRAGTSDSDRSNKKGGKWRSLGSLFVGRKTEQQPLPPAQQQNQQSSHMHNQVAPTASSDYNTFASNPGSGQQWGVYHTRQESRPRKRAGSEKEKGLEISAPLTNPQLARRPSLMRRASSKKKSSAAVTARRRAPSEVRVEIRRPPPPQVSAAFPAPALNALSLHPPGMMSSGTPDIAVGLERENGKVLDPVQSAPLLQVEIPEVKMERYSVMFGHVLRPPSVVAPPNPAIPEARSIAKLESLAEMPDKINHLPRPAHVRKGSASSVRSKSSFSLFPAPKPMATTKHAASRSVPKISRLNRAVTDPEEINDIKPRRPALRLNKSTEGQNIGVVGKENIPLSKWNTTHSREGSQSRMHDRTASLDTSIRSRTSVTHIAQSSIDWSFRSALSHQNRPSQSSSSHSPMSSRNFEAPGETKAKEATRVLVPAEDGFTNRSQLSSQLPISPPISPASSGPSRPVSPVEGDGTKQEGSSAAPKKTFNAYHAPPSPPTEVVVPFHDTTSHLTAEAMPTYNVSPLSQSPASSVSSSPILSGFPHPGVPEKKAANKQITRTAFPVRKSSLKRLSRSGSTTNNNGTRVKTKPKPAPLRRTRPPLQATSSLSSSLSSLSSSSSPDTPPNNNTHNHTDIDGNDNEALSPVEVSIARQISVSRDQRRKLNVNVIPEANRASVVHVGSGANGRKSGVGRHTRKLSDRKPVPSHVPVQVLVRAREEGIKIDSGHEGGSGEWDGEFF